MIGCRFETGDRPYGVVRIGVRLATHLPRTLRWGLAGLTLALAACSPAVDDAGCTLTFQRITTLEPPPGDEGFPEYFNVSAELPGGLRAVMLVQGGEFPLLLFDTAGRFVDTLGGRGSGPGEYLRPELVLRYRRDSIIVLDRANGRATVLDSTYRVARSFPMTFPVIWGAALADGSLALSHGTGARRRVGRYGPEGAPLDSPPWSYERLVGGSREDPWLHVGAELDGTWWTLSLNLRFEFRRYDGRDSLLADWTFPPELLPPHEEDLIRTPTRPPQPSIWSAVVDRQNRLWTFAAIADSQWAEGLGPAESGEGGQEFHPTTDRHALYDGLVIVSETATGRVLASWRLDSLPGSPIEPGVLLTGTEDDDGWFHPELRRPVPSSACGLE